MRDLTVSRPASTPIGRSARAALCVRVLVVSTLLLSACGYLVSVRDPIQPSVKWNALQHDFGSVAADAPLQCTFVVHNISTHPMVIHDVRSSCGCITHERASRDIAPNASCDISVEISTTGMIAPADINKYVDVTLEQNGHTHKQRLALSAQLRPALSIDPSPLVLIADTFDGPAKGQVTVRRELLAPETFLSIIARVPECYGFSTIKHTSNELVCEVTATGGDIPVRLPPLTFNYQDHSRDRTLSVPVHLIGDQDVRVVPSSLVVTIAPGSTAADAIASWRKVARLESTRDESLRIVDVQTVSGDEKDTFSWSVDPASPDSIEITVVVPPAGTAIHSARFEIIFERSGDVSQGRAVLRAYAVTTGKAVASSR